MVYTSTQDLIKSENVCLGLMAQIFITIIYEDLVPFIDIYQVCGLPW